MTAQDVKQARDSCRLGDVVEVHGVQGAEPGVLSAHSLTVLKRWAESHPNEHFKPLLTQRQVHSPESPSGQLRAH